MRTFDDLKLGQSARIREIMTSSALGQRLMELGLLPGTDISLVQIAPLGDPIAIQFRGRRVSLRRHEAVGITLD